MKTDEIRDRFLNFFQKKGHKIVRSDSLVPTGDDTVLFTSAGMNQFKPQFMGRITDFTRATTSQKCLRTDDLPEVGKTPFHHTFFEMLGNFSFGDYFKREAIHWAWELLTKEFRLPAERLRVSVHKDDEEAYLVWKDEIGVKDSFIYKLGDKTNFWPANAIKDGPNGPCGPCSEIFFDSGVSDKGHTDCGVDCDCGRFAEIWNLVFTQYNRLGEGNIVPLPRKNIDTGMGLERIAAVLQGKRYNFEIDIFNPIVGAIEHICKQRVNDANRQNIYAIADHIRAIVFSIGDGVIPSNEGRGYVVRKLIRKALWHLYTYGARDPILHTLTPIVGDVMKAQYPEVLAKSDQISQLILFEEERFLATLENGMQSAEKEIKAVAKSGRNTLPGQVIFKLYDTYGFPIEMTEELAAKKGLSIDIDGFRRHMERQRAQSKAALLAEADIFAKRSILECGQGAVFVGYETMSKKTNIKAIIIDGERKKHAKEGAECEIVLDESPFYGESGGQIGDRGEIKKSDGSMCDVIDSRKAEDIVYLKCKIVKGAFKEGDSVMASVDEDRRMDIARNHTATHLLQAALREVLGTHIEQSGSMVSDERLRFDFSHNSQLSQEQIELIEEKVNGWIMQDIPVKKSVLPYDEAIKKGALAFFGEKYGDTVRVVEVPSVSLELCGGTHLDATGEIGSFKIISEKSIAAGIRRIEAITGRMAVREFQRTSRIIDEASLLLQSNTVQICDAIKRLIDKNKALEETVSALKRQLFAQKAKEAVSSAQEINGIKAVFAYFEDMGMNELLLVWDGLAQRKDVECAFIVSSDNAKASFVIAAKDAVIKKGADMRDALNVLKREMGAKGGGRPNRVQAVVPLSGEDRDRILSKMQEAFAAYLGSVKASL